MNRSRSHYHLAFGIFALSMSGGCGGGCVPLEAPDTCELAESAAGVRGVEIGLLQGEVFTTLADGDLVTLIYGGQGAAMAPVALRVTGPELPRCLGQRTTITVLGGGEIIGSEERPVSTYDDGVGRYTKPLYVVLGYGNYEGLGVAIEASVGAIGVTRVVYFDAVDTVDAGSNDAADAVDAADAADAAGGGADAAADAGADAAAEDAGTDAGSGAADSGL